MTSQTHKAEIATRLADVRLAKQQCIGAVANCKMMERDLTWCTDERKDMRHARRAVISRIRQLVRRERYLAEWLERAAAC